MKTQTPPRRFVGFRMDSDTYAEVERLAEDTDRSVSAVIRRAVKLLSATER
jgi:predicted transcriptional regulator